MSRSASRAKRKAPVEPNCIRCDPALAYESHGLPRDRRRAADDAGHARFTPAVRRIVADEADETRDDNRWDEAQPGPHCGCAGCLAQWPASEYPR